MNNSKELVLKSYLLEGVCLLKLNDPERLNAMSEEMATQFSEIVSTLLKDNSLKAVIISGEGRAFSAGGDLNMLESKIELSREENYSRMMDFYKSFLIVKELQVPVMAAINGHAVGAGLCFALACDFRLCKEGSKLGVNFLRLGLYPGMGSTFSLSKAVGYSQAAKLLFTGDIISSEEGGRIGLVDEVASKECFDARVLEIAGSLVSCGPQGMKALKANLRREGLGPAQRLEEEAVCQAESYSSKEFKEGVRAAIEKRPARFS